MYSPRSKLMTMPPSQRIEGGGVRLGVGALGDVRRRCAAAPARSARSSGRLSFQPVSAQQVVQVVAAPVHQDAAAVEDALTSRQTGAAFFGVPRAGGRRAAVRLRAAAQRAGGDEVGRDLRGVEGVEPRRAAGGRRCRRAPRSCARRRRRSSPRASRSARACRPGAPRGPARPGARPAGEHDGLDVRIGDELAGVGRRVRRAELRGRGPRARRQRPPSQRSRSAGIRTGPSAGAGCP